MTKELLSELYSSHIVLEFSIKNPYEILIEFDGFEEIVNIYELAHKCKEWAIRQGRDLYSGTYSFNIQKKTCDVYNLKDYSNKLIKHTVADTEPEAIFRACEWILEQKEIEL